MNRIALLTASLVLASLVACGSSEQMPQSNGEQMPQSKEFNRVLNAGATDGPEIFSLSVSAEKQHEKIYLFCRLRNVSGQAVRIDGAYLPWNTLGMITAIAFDARGNQLRTNPNLGGIFVEGDYHDMAAGQELTGSIDMDAFLHESERPTAGDVVLRWVYLPRLENPSGKQRALSGTTLLPEQLR
jgi:hypothetical protein